jgi:citrate lyase subunit beta/citryl-CoA lyase
MEKALTLGADALILDLEDAVSLENKDAAREHVAKFLSASREHGVRLLVRINPLDSGFSQTDLCAVLGASPDAVMLPKADGAEAIRQTLSLMEEVGHKVPILPLTVETPDALFTLNEYQTVKENLSSLTWGAEDLSASLGTKGSRDHEGHLREPLKLARSLIVFAARAAGVPAIETVFADFKDEEGLKVAANQAALDGFSGMMAIHPAQVPIINEAFKPSAEEIAHARLVIEAFENNPGQGAQQIKGKMIDAAHLKLAQSLIERSS